MTSTVAFLKEIVLLARMSKLPSESLASLMPNDSPGPNLFVATITLRMSFPCRYSRSGIFVCTIMRNPYRDTLNSTVPMRSTNHWAAFARADSAIFSMYFCMISMSACMEEANSFRRRVAKLESTSNMSVTNPKTLSKPSLTQPKTGSSLSQTISQNLRAASTESETTVFEGL